MKKWMQYTGENIREYHGELFDGPKLRDQGIKQVTSNNENWMQKALSSAQIWIIALGNCDFTGEDIRFDIEGITGSPKHPNAWGALINALVKRKIIAPTGEYRKPKDKSSHARAIQVYRAT